MASVTSFLHVGTGEGTCVSEQKDCKLQPGLHKKSPPKIISEACLERQPWCGFNNCVGVCKHACVGVCAGWLMSCVCVCETSDHASCGSCWLMCVCVCVCVRPATMLLAG